MATWRTEREAIDACAKALATRAGQGDNWQNFLHGNEFAADLVAALRALNLLSFGYGEAGGGGAGGGGGGGSEGAPAGPGPKFKNPVGGPGGGGPG